MTNKILNNKSYWNSGNRNKKSQVEIIGLLIIVIMVVMVVFIVISFKLKSQPETIHKNYMNDQMSASFLLALLDSGSKCTGSVSLREVIEDCATVRRFSCLGGLDSCTYINESIPYILNNTLDLWGVYYKFTMNHASFEKYDNFTFSQGCGPNSQVYKVVPQIIPLWPNPNDVKVEMKICSS